MTPFQPHNRAAPPNLPPTHFLDTRIYTDRAIFEDERPRIFAHCWRLAGHVSELPQVGDFRTIEVAGVPIVIVRGEDGSIRGFYNVCSHRGAPVVRGVRGNVASGMQCLYHLWTYDLADACTGITRPEAYRNCGLRREELGLRPVRTEAVCGLVFVTLDDGAPPLEAFLGGALDHLKEHLSDDLEVFHYHSAEIQANWKLFVDNDAEQYHEFLHVLNRTTGMRHPSYHERKWLLYRNGHSVIEQNEIDYGGFNLDVRGENLIKGMRPNGMIVILLFPDVMVNIRSTVVRIDTQVPLGPGRTLVEWRGLGFKDDSPDVRAMRIRHHNQVWGLAGRNLPEDVTVVESQWRNMASGASRYNIIAREEDLKPQDDANMRWFYEEWGRRIGRTPSDPFDEGRFSEYVELFMPNGEYRLEAHSPEIGRDMVWLSLNRTELDGLFREWPLHVRDPATRTHLVTVSGAEAGAGALSTFTVFRTDERGRSEFYCVGRYTDDLRVDAAVWKLVRRRARLETRLLSTPTPLPV